MPVAGYDGFIRTYLHTVNEDLYFVYEVHVIDIVGDADVTSSSREDIAHVDLVRAVGGGYVAPVGYGVW